LASSIGLSLRGHILSVPPLCSSYGLLPSGSCLWKKAPRRLVEIPRNASWPIISMPASQTSHFIMYIIYIPLDCLALSRTSCQQPAPFQPCRCLKPARGRCMGRSFSSICPALIQAYMGSTKGD
jgi:hypothetical protein